MVDQVVQFKAVERDPLSTNRDFGEVWADLRIEPVAIHAEVTRGIVEAEQPRRDGGGGIVFVMHGGASCCAPTD